ncbi:hypothetical protein [Thermomonas sp. HDW16]|uniref:hypothetical protein n=1 Tax=Thermomonas sp. HDW16 TaxID=2714945 RepID=UPI00140B9DBF|nr:hypothetical protein [Thermomonas sp. HDW16]QIL20083.1 hypothetical protein G7079_04665 [Thermomonas sp. HDW16]
MKPFTRIAALLLAAVAVLQAVRVLSGWPVNIDGYSVPTWTSAVFAVLAGLLAVMLWREGRM